MNNLELIESSNRRSERMNRRQCADRRRHSVAETNSVESVQTLRMLLDESHARIRALERAIENLKTAVDVAQGRR
jgi:hypothetical protein